MTATVHGTAIVEPGVELGEGTVVWDSVHIRGPGTRIGADCIVGEKTYIAYGVRIGDRVKLNAFVYVPTGVTIEDGVMVSAHVAFTNDRYPRATTPDLRRLRPSEPDDGTLATVVREGATIGAGAAVGPGLEIGRFAMVAMGAVVTRPVLDFHLVAGNPARTVGVVGREGVPLLRATDGCLPDTGALVCPASGLSYTVRGGAVVELDAPS
jgi:UDP-2-acetamido-3-amino-2,3-dideoxy-glucuronate N-acetyltransferase